MYYKKKDYISYLRKHGIRCGSINDTISSILEKYNIYCENNGLKSTLYSYKGPVTGEKDYDLTNFTTLLKYSDYKDKYVDTSITPMPSDYDDKIYYVGNLPKESNWMLLPYNTRNDLKELVSRIIYDDDFDTWEDKTFF